MNILSLRQAIKKLSILLLILGFLLPFQDIVLAKEPGIEGRSSEARQSDRDCDTKTPGKMEKCIQAKAQSLEVTQAVPGDPLSFYVYSDTSTAMFYDGLQQFYGENAEGIFVWVNGLVYGPGELPAGQSTYAYTPISNSLSGSGTALNPWKVTTVVGVGDTGLRIEQDIRYMNGDPYITYSWRITNTTDHAISYTLFHAADLYTNDDDYGFGYFNPTTRAIGGYNSDHTFYQYFQPITPANHFFEGYYRDTWSRIGSIYGQGVGFDDTYRPNDYIDNSVGLQWDKTISAHNTYIISDYGVFNTQIGGFTCYSLDVQYQPSMGTVIPSPSPNCPTGSGYTSNTTVTLRAVPANGYRFLGWSGDASSSSTITNVVISNHRSVSAKFDLIRQSILPPVVLVHGWHGIPGAFTDTCNATTVAYHATNANNLPPYYDFGVFAKNLIQDNRDVWIAHIATGPGGTPMLRENAACLKRQLIDIRAQTGSERVALIGHSMGGLVSRSYIESDGYMKDVSYLITLGSPHAGTTYMYTYCLAHPTDYASCELTPLGMLLYNGTHYKRDGVSYNLIGGNLTPGLAGYNLLDMDGENDGVVGVNSGMGLMYPISIASFSGENLNRYSIKASHSSLKFGPVTDILWFPSFFNKLTGISVDQTTPTDSYNCVRKILNIDGGSCPPAQLSQEDPLTLPVPLTQPELSVVYGFHALPELSGHLTTGQAATHSAPLDANKQSYFTLTWTTGDLSFTLQDPNGKIIDPAYANTHPTEVSYQENKDPDSELFASYALAVTVPGQYLLSVSAGNLATNGTDYTALILTDSSRTLSIATDEYLYGANNTANITATLKNGDRGLTGAVVQAWINQYSGFSDTIILNDQGGGVYQAAYSIPDTPGYLGITIIANGTDSGIAYARKAETLVGVVSSAIQLTGTYSDHVNDEDNNGKYESLVVDVDVQVSQAGEYIASADILSGNEIIAHTVAPYALNISGSDTIALSFDGDDIRHSGKNGPYTLTNLSIMDQQNGGMPSIWKVENLWQTAAYDFHDMASSCFALNIDKDLPGGGRILLDPAPNCNNGLQYTGGTDVVLTLLTNPKYTFTGWSGDAGGASNSVQLTMSSDKSVKAFFTKNGADTVGVFRPSNGLLYLKNRNVSGIADVAINYGLGGDYPVVGDWDGNGTDTIGVYRNGRFLLRKSNTLGYADLSFAFGQAGDQPVAGDWDGDGVDTIGVYRPTTGLFLLRNSNSAGPADASFYLGNVGDVGIAGDWNGDGLDTTGVFRPSNGILFLKNTNVTGFADVALNYGLAGDKPVVGDWDNNGTTTIGIYRGAKFFLRNSNTNGYADVILDLGIPGDMPIAGNWDGMP